MDTDRNIETSEASSVYEGQWVSDEKPWLALNWSAR
jgi:hypothetical protein